MRILGIETSCDETAAAVIEATSPTEPVTLLSNVVSSSLKLHSKTGGIIPEIAAREQIKYILPVIQQALQQANIRHSGLSRINPSRFKQTDSGVVALTPPQNDTIDDIDAIAVTYGPGLIGSLLVGVETAKTLAYVWNKPLIPVNHLYGHIYANWLIANSVWPIDPSAISHQPSAIAFPALALIVSGAHTDLVLLKQHGDIQWLGGTRDDAAGEAFDKIGRLLNIPYPAGPTIEKLAKKGNPKAYHFPRPLHDSHDFDFSFSGLKTAVMREVQKEKSLDAQTIADIARGTQDAITDVLIQKTLKAAIHYNVKSILLGGGVAANQTLREQFELNAKRSTLNPAIFVPQKSLCTDNAAMIAAAGFYNYKEISWQALTADPELYFD